MPTQASGIAPKQNAFKFEIAPHKQKSIVQKNLARRWPSLANGALCLSTPNHNGKSGTGIQHIMCCVFALFVFVLSFMHPILIVPSVFSNVYLKT